jgi:hypothetical protein
MLKCITVLMVCTAFPCSNVLGQTAQSSTQSQAAPQGSAQDQPPQPKQDQPSQLKSTPSDNPAVTKIKQEKDDLKEIEAAVNAEKDRDFALVIGIGSLIVASGSTDYSNQANVLHSNNLGRATPQFLTGVSFRSNIPNFSKFRGDETWQRKPWNAFVSLKFSPNSSQTINGFVFGVSYSAMKNMNILAGYSLTPINEPSPGFRQTAAQFVTAQQKQQLDLQFDPNAMLQNSPNAFDGFPVTDPTGKLIYAGNPVTVHYRTGVMLGVSFPIYFSSVFK